MEQKLTVLLLVVIAVLLAISLLRPPEAEGWSYLVLSPKDADLISELDKAGAAGYQLVFARRASNSGSNAVMGYEMILMRKGVVPVQFPAK